jgi:hypothetical protein
VARVRFGADAGHDAYRGLYLSDEQVSTALQSPSFRTHHEAWPELDGGWAWLRSAYGLSDAELDVVLIALGPEVDLRYERLYGYLQDDVGKRRATVDLVLDLISTEPDDKVARRALFDEDAPLRRHHVVRLTNESDRPLLAQTVVLDPQVADILLDVAAAPRRTRELAALTRRVQPVCTWGDLVVPDATAAQLRELCARVGLRSTVFDEWGFGAKLARGRGTTALFTGPPGTGKTTAAEVVAGELGVELFAIDLSTVVSKYIGETEKNLERIFTAAAASDAILLFDEADALFGKRSEVHDAHDRYANVETSYLLQRMEQYDGVAILATNLRQNLDEAFTRRLQFVVEFPFPDEELREGIWRVCFPPGAPLAGALDLAGLARDFRLSGANIRNAALRAAFLAAGRREPIGMTHIRQAIDREFQHLGRVPPEQGW